MGLYGALIVRPLTPMQAYGARTEYDVEEVLVLSEIDLNLNRAPDPNAFDFVGDPDVYTAGYHPTYFLINGETYPAIDNIPAAVGDSVLLRYVNAAPSHHTMTLLGEHQRVVAKDAYPTDNPYDAVAETIPAGSTLDTIVTLDGVTGAGQAPALQSPAQRDQQRVVSRRNADLHLRPMSTPPAGAQRARPPAAIRALGLPVIVLVVCAAIGFWAASTRSSPSVHAAQEGAGIASAAEHTADHGEAASQPSESPAAPIALPETASSEEFTRLTGLEVLSVAVSGAGGIIDLRYRAVDQATANAQVGHQAGSGIFDPKTGTLLTAQWMGHAHPPTSYQPDRNYWMLFSNPDELVKSGDLVSIHLGPAVLTGVPVL